MYKLPEKAQKDFIKTVCDLLHQKDREQAKSKLEELTRKYDGQEINTLSVMYWAAKRDKFDEYVTKLEDRYESDGKDITPHERSKVVNVQIDALEVCLRKELEIRDGRRSPKDRSYMPKVFQRIMRCPEAIQEELFFFECYQDLDVKPNEE